VNVEKGMHSIIGDIRDLDHLKKAIKEANPDILIHMAAQALVRYSYSNPVETYATNVMGTVHGLEAARDSQDVKAILYVTSDKCYDNKEIDRGYREDEPMGGFDPYSNSKGCAELVSMAYRNSFFNSVNSAAIASARAGNVIGGGDWSEDRLIPDILKSFEKKSPVVIRNPMATRPWQHVLEPLSGYLVLAEHLFNEGKSFAEAWNFGPKDEDCKPVSWILDKMVANWNDHASWELDKNNNPHEAGYLKLDCSKAAAKLNWKPKWDLDFTLGKIINWHQSFLNGSNIHDECLNEIVEYQRN
jgi:CDP-glucose 4,6-dehydratase